MRNPLSIFNGLSLVMRIIIIAVIVIAVGFAVHRLSGALHYLVFGDTEAKRERGNVVIAKAQTAAEGQIAGKAIDQVHERDVYREHVTEVVRQSKDRINGSWHGETVGPDVDAAGADALCRLHDSFCRQPRPATMQPLR